MTTRTPESTERDHPARDSSLSEPRDSIEFAENFAVASPASSSDDALTGGESLPRLPSRDAARLLVQSPHRLYLYWSFARDPLCALRRAFGEMAARFALGVRLIDLERDAIGDSIAAGGEGSLWLDARPRRPYRAEVGFFAEGLPFIRVLSSNIAETPPAAASELTDDAADFHIGARDFGQMLAASGFADRAREFSSHLNETSTNDAAMLVNANARVGANTKVGAKVGVTAHVASSASSSFSLSRFAPSSFGREPRW